MADFYNIHDGKLSVKLHTGQARAWRSDRRFVFVIAGTQSGKTSFVPLWLDREIKRAGHGDYLAATSTFDLYKVKFLPEMRRYFVDTFGWTEDKSDRIFWKQWQSKPSPQFDRIILRSASSEGGLESATVKAAVLDECGQDEFRVGAWEAVQRRLSLSQGRVLGTTTPYNLGWLKTEVYDRWRNKDEDYEVIQFKSIENPVFPVKEYERARDTLPRWKFEMFYNGEFSRPAGLIYEDFDEHALIEPFDIPSSWERVVGIDFGAVHTALLWLAHDPNKDVWIVYRESLEGNKSTQQHVNAALELARDENVYLWAGGASSETQQRMDWQAAGIDVVEPGIRDVEAGIDRVVSLFKTKRLKVFKTLTGLRDELGTYSRKLDDSGQPTEVIKDKETFHRIDALRYGVIAIETGGVSVIDNPFDF